MRTSCLAIGILLLGARGAPAQNRPQPLLPAPSRTIIQPRAPREVPAGLLADLGSADIKGRESATLRLVAGEDFILADIEQALRTRTLSIEQRFRLLQAARDKFMTSQHAAMGVQFSTSLPDRVVVRLTFPQFPSSKLLEAGDIIIAAAGEPLRGRDSQSQLGAQIIARDPGQVLPIVIRRGEEKIKLDIPLGRFSDLPQGNVDPYRLARAWMVRSAGYLVSVVPQPIDCGVPADKWEAGAGSAQQIRKARAQMQLPVYRSRIVAGGQPRGGALNNDEINAIYNMRGKGALMDVRIVQPPANIFIDPFGDTGNVRVKTIKQEIADLEKELEKAKLEEAQQPKKSGQPNPAADPNAFMSNQRDSVKVLEKELTAIKAEAAEMGDAEEAGTHLAQP